MPRKKKKQNEEKGFMFEPLEEKSSPGFLMKKKKLVFEQINKNEYVAYNLYSGSFQILETGPMLNFLDADNNIIYLPLRRVPWPLSKPKLSFVLSQESELWQEIRQFIYDHIDVVEPELYDVLAAWIFATYIPEIWRVVPYIFFYGPVATGKTRGLETLQILCYRGFLGSNISSAALFRSCDKWHPTVCLDETEIYSSSDHIEVVGLLNAGYRRGQYALRVKMSEQGTELEAFDVFGFKALSGTEGLAKTLESRSIKIRMIKNTRPVRFLIDEEKADELRGKLLMWRFLKLRNLLCEECEGNERFLEVPSHLKFANGRLIELFQPLLAVANEGHENIVKYAKKVHEIRQLEEETSVEAMILNALIDSQDLVEEKFILTKDIRNTLNADIPKREHFKTTTVGRIMRRLGFLPRHSRRGNGWIWNDSRITLLKTRYLPESITSQKASHPSQLSQSIIETKVVSPGVTPALLITENKLAKEKTLGSYDFRIHLTPIAPNEPAEKCEQCGDFPVAWAFIQDGKTLRRCNQCVEQLKGRGFKFTTLRGVNDN